MRKSLLRICLAFLVLVVGCLSYDIPDVTRETVKQEAEVHDELLVYFYATWCGLCQSFEPVFESLAEKYGAHGKLGFAKINGGDDRAFAGAIVGDTYPGVALWRKGQFYLHARTDITKEAISSWIEQYTGAPVEMFATEDAARKRATDFRVSFVAVIKTDDDLRTLEEFAWERRHYGKFVGYRNSTVPKSSISVKHVGERERQNAWVNSDDLEKFCNDARFPLFGPVDDSNQHIYYLRGLDPVLVFGTPKDVKPLTTQLRTLAAHFRNELSFMWYDTRSEAAQRSASQQGVTRYPGIVTYLGTMGSPRDRKRYLYWGSEEDPEELKAWLKSVRAGKVRPQVQSTAQKPSDRKFESDVVTWVTGDKFEDQVFYEDADFLLLLSAPRGSELFPGCTRCETAIQQLDTLVKKVLPSDAPLKVGELMVTANEIPLRGWGGKWELQTLPVFYFIPAGQRERFSEWSATLDTRSLLTRWEAETERFKEQASAARQTFMQMEGPIDQEVTKASDKSLSEKEKAKKGQQNDRNDDAAATSEKPGAKDEL